MRSGVLRNIIFVLVVVLASRLQCDGEDFQLVGDRSECVKQNCVLEKMLFDFILTVSFLKIL